MRFCGEANEQRGIRPGLVFQNNTGNAYSPNIIVLPLTSSIKKLNQPTHVYVPSNGTGLLKNSVVLCENPETMSKDKIGEYLTTLPREYMEKIAIASMLASSAISFIKPEVLMAVREKALMLNATA